MQYIKTDPQTCHGNQPQPTWRLVSPRWTSFCVTVCVALTLSACASLGGGKPEEQVRQRATERWQALVAGKFSRAYSYDTPGFRAVVTPDGYRNRIGSAIAWVGAEVIKVDCPEASQCVAVVRIDFKPVLSRKFDEKLSTHVNETWLFQEGQWYFFQDIKH
jgi:hypothetical protein